MTEQQALNIARDWVLGHYFASVPEDALENFDDFIGKYAEQDEQTMNDTNIWFVFEQYEPEEIVDYIMADVANLTAKILAA